MKKGVGRRRGAGLAILALLFTGAVFFAVFALADRLPPALWPQALWHPDPDDMRQMLVHHSLLPRLLVSLLAGAALGLAGVLFQQVLQNPLAEPTTLGVSAAASLALAVATLWFPAALAAGREGIALAGATAAAFVALGLANARLSPLTVVLAGLVVNFFCGSVAAILTIFNFDYLTSLAIWGSGSLAQNDWSVATALTPRLGVGLALALLLIRPLALLDLGEGGAAGLGSSYRRTRLLALLLAVTLSASVVAAVGTIGFVGLAAPLVARLAFGHDLRWRMIGAALFGAAILCCADQGVQALAGPRGERLPTGIATALLGAVLLLALVRRRGEAAIGARHFADATAPAAQPARILVLLGALLLAAAALAVVLGRADEGLLWNFGDDPFALRLRLPRVVAALAAGAMLAAAGVAMQRLAGNPMAGPEVLGVSSGAALGAVAAAFLPFGGTRAAQLLAAGFGAFAVLVLMLAAGRRHAFAPERLLLTGIAFGALLSAVVALMVASGDPRAVAALSWMAGSTYRVGAPEALAVALVAAGLLASLPLVLRWLDILPLGPTIAKALGLPLAASRLALLVIAALLSAAATIVIGPFSFVGVMAPHLARMMGLQRPAAQLGGAVLCGALVLVIADWLGRNLLFPWEIPAGLLAAFVCGPYLVWLLRRAS